MSQQRLFEYLEHGQTPFFRLPTAVPEAGLAPQYDRFDAVLLGVPYDGGTTYLPGARMGPYHVRRVSALLQSYHPVHRTDVFDKLRVVDGGNVAFPPFDPRAVGLCIHGKVSAVVTSGAVPFIVGGDHTLAFPSLRAIAERHG